MSRESDVERLRVERDLFRALLDLGGSAELVPFLQRTLELVSIAVGATRGYLEVPATLGVVHAGFGLEAGDVARVKAQLSHGIVAEALRTGATISTASAVDDPSFSRFESVQQNRILAVLCAPIVLGDARLGVLYLAGRAAPGPFAEDDRLLLERVARAIAPTLDRVLDAMDDRKTVDHTAALRERLAVSGIVGTSARLASVFRQMTVAAPVDVPVLVLGESGTGKSAFARALHDSSPRKRGPFVEVNAGALPEHLVESELFGAEKGAHSTATQRVAGKVEAARGGTLFLDEIADMPLAAQAKLLTFLQNKRYYRLGGTEALVADVRVIAATNQDVEARVRAKAFREDLYYRLNVLEVHLPSLEDRRDDVPAIADHVLARVRGEHPIRLSRAASKLLSEMDWPGNVRQLENVITRGFATALSEGASEIAPHHLVPASSKRASVPETAGMRAEPLTFREATQRFHAELVERALDDCDWNVSETARRLDVARSHLNTLIRTFGLTRARSRGGAG